MSFCAGCTACCRGDRITLLRGDDPSLYETVEVKGKRVLKRDANGNCVYLTEAGCSIYDRQPIMCRQYNCVSHFRSMTRLRRRWLIKQNPAFKDVFRAARERGAA